MEFLELDLTADKADNRIIGEERTLLLETDRLFVPAYGCFYHKDLVIRNAANGQVLAPIEDYNLYELVIGLAQSNAPYIAYSIIHVVNRNIQKVSYDYRAVGDIYQITGENATELLGPYLTNASDTYPWGNVFNVPVQLPPELHMEPVAQTYNAGTFTLVMGRIADAIRNGDPLAMSGLALYMNDVADQYYADAVSQLDELDGRLNSLLSSHEKREGDYIITDSSDNPSNRYGGYWSLQPNILLRGAGPADVIGDLTPIATGTGVNARYTYIWQKGQDLGQITYSLAASATTVNEGDSVTFTLTTTGLSAGQLVPYRITGSAGFEAADITPTPLLGNFTINGSGIGTLVVSLSEDALTEGSETFTLALTNANVTGASVTITVNDTSKSPTLVLKFSANSNGTGSITQTNEGTTAYLVATVNNLTLPHTLTLSNSGTISDADLADPRPTSLIVDVSPKVLPYSFLNDALTEGNQTLTVAASSATFTTPVSKTLTVKDTSLSPTFSLYFSSAANGSGTITNRDEGLPFYLVLVTTNVAAGEVFDIVYTGNAVSGDFTQARPISLTIGNDGKAIVPYTTTLDNVTDGAKTMGVLIQDGGTTVANGEITINDTSQNPAYTAFWSSNNTGTTQITQVNEGSNFYLWVSTTGVASGTQLTIEYSGTTNAADLVDARPTTLTIGSGGSGSILYTAKNDFTTEGIELMIATIKNGSTIVATATIEFVDTSVNSTYNIYYSSDAAGQAQVVQVNEGQTFYLQTVTSNVPAGTVLNITYTGTSNASDYSQNRPTTMTVDAQGRAVATLVLKNDFTVEGSETLISSVSRAGNNVGSATVSIIDTSVPTIAARYSLSAQGIGTITSINEDTNFYLVITTRGYPNTKVLNLSVTSNAGDLSTSPPATLALVVPDINVSTTTTVLLKAAKDYLTEGNETLTVTIKDTNNTTVLTTASVTISDTSKTPTFNSYWSANSSGTGTITTSAVDTTVYLVTNTTNLSDGELVGVQYDGTFNTGLLANQPTTNDLPVTSGRTIRAVDLTLNSNVLFRFQANAGNFPEITEADEGDVAYLVFKSASYTNSTIYFAYPTGNPNGPGSDPINLDDFFDSQFPSSASTDANGDYTFEFTIQEDFFTEGLEYFTVEVYSDSMQTNLIGSATLLINDTSTTQEITINLTSTTSGVNLKDRFVTEIGREPTALDRVHFVVPNGVKIIGLFPRSRVGLILEPQGAIQVGNWPTGAKVRGTTMQGGVVLGRGGAGGYAAWDGVSPSVTFLPAEHGGACMVEGDNPNVVVPWINRGVMAGGGGGGGLKLILGGYNDNPGTSELTTNQPPVNGLLEDPNRKNHLTIHGGGGGAPLGQGGSSGHPTPFSPFYSIIPADSAQNAGDGFVGGEGFNHWEPLNEGKGGDAGEYGNDGYLYYNTLGWPGVPFVAKREPYAWTDGGQPGHLIIPAPVSGPNPRKNNLYIINVGIGLTKGL